MADILFECIFKAICEGCGPCLGAVAECMFKLIATGCVPLIRCLCWCNFSNWAWSSGRSQDFNGCCYVILFCIIAALVIGILAMGIYALAQYVQDANPAVAAGVACAIVDRALTGVSFSAVPVTIDRSKAMNVVSSVTTSPITVFNRCFNNNGGSAKFRVDGKLAAYTKLDNNLYSCTGDLTHRFEYGTTLRVLKADKSLLASTDRVPSTGSITTFRDASNAVVATIAPAAVGSGFDIRILISTSPAADPLVLLAAAAFAQFTSSGFDECNGFVLAGGIVDLILLCLLVAYGVYSAVQFHRLRSEIKSKFYEPDGVINPERYDRNDWAAEEYRQDRAAATAPPFDSEPHRGSHPTLPRPVAVASNTQDLIQIQDSPSSVQPYAASAAAPSAPSFMAPPQTPAFPPPPTSKPTPQPAREAAPSTQPTGSYWEGADLRDKLAPVGYTKLKRYLILHNVECGSTLLKDELITLAIIHRGRIDFSPLISI